MPGAFLEIERLVNRTIQIEHEMDAEVPMVLQYIETLPADAADIEVNDKLVHHFLKQREIPAASADPFQLRCREIPAAQAVPIRRV